MTTLVSGVFYIKQVDGRVLKKKKLTASILISGQISALLTYLLAKLCFSLNGNWILSGANLRPSLESRTFVGPTTCTRADQYKIPSRSSEKFRRFS